MAKCGAKTRAGTPCKNEGLENGRCRFHGGYTPKGQRNALRYGIYSGGIAPGERELWETIQVGSLDDEIRLAKLQLVRAFRARLQQGEELRLEQESDESGYGPGGRSDKITKVRKRPDFDEAIDRLLRRIGQLETQRAQITGVGEDKSPREWAEEIRGALSKIEETDGADAALDAT